MVVCQFFLRSATMERPFLARITKLRFRLALPSNLSINVSAFS